MPPENIIRNVLSIIREIKGVHQVIVLSDEDKEKVLELERQAERKVIMGLVKGDNQGVKTALNRAAVIASVTDSRYVWPLGPSLLIFWKGKFIGEEVSDPKKLEKLRDNRNVVLIGSLVLYKDRILGFSLTTKEPPIVVFPAKPFPTVEKITKVYDAVQGSPSPPTNRYLKMRMKADLEDTELGTIVVGFNFL